MRTPFRAGIHPAHEAPHSGRSRPFGRSPVAAFTLVEVILAILIMVAILSVVLYFYQYIADLRKRALDESEQVSVVRLFMEQITTELRLARTSENPYAPFEGGPDFISFLTTSLPGANRTPGALTNTPAGNTLRLIYYGLTVGTNSESATGLDRSEEPFGRPPAPVSTNGIPGKAGEVPAEKKSVSLTFDEQADSNPAQVPLAAPPAGLTDQIRFLRFRYWDGAAWQDSWSSTDLPMGVEVTVGKEPLSKEEAPDDYPFEIFQRVIHLPASHAREREPDRETATEATTP